MTFPHVQNAPLPPNTIVPENKDLFIPYLNRLYEDIAFAVNNKVDRFFPFAISDVPADIPNLPNFGAYIICVSGSTSGLPTYTAMLNKPDSGVAGTITNATQGAGTVAPFVAAVLTITSSATNFQIAHNAAGVTGNFNIKFIGTQ